MSKMSKKRVLLIVLLAILIMCSNIMMTFATTKSDLEKERQSINDKIKQAQEELQGIKDNMSETMNQIKKLTTQISDYETEIRDLDTELKNLEQSISDTADRLEEAERRYEKQDEMLKARIVALYEAGETTYLDVLLTSSGIADFISNYFLISELATYDSNLLEQMERNKNEIQEIKEQLELAKEQIEVVKASKERTANSLKDSQRVKERYIEELSEDEKQKRAELEQFDRDQKAIQSELARLALSESGGSGLISNQGFIKPVQSQFYINAGYPYGAVTSSGGRHTGVDYIGSGISGSPIFAVADGIVVRSMAYHNGSNYYSYGECIVIDHGKDAKGNVIYTLYSHGIAGSRKVSVGQRVTQGQTIMNVGSTGNSTGPHLHFEVLVNGSPVNPLSYLP